MGVSPRLRQQLALQQLQQLLVVAACLGRHQSSLLWKLNSDLRARPRVRQQLPLQLQQLHLPSLFLSCHFFLF